MFACMTVKFQEEGGEIGGVEEEEEEKDNGEEVLLGIFFEVATGKLHRRWDRSQKLYGRKQPAIN